MLKERPSAFLKISSSLILLPLSCIFDFSKIAHVISRGSSCLKCKRSKDFDRFRVDIMTTAAFGTISLAQPWSVETTGGTLAMLSSELLLFF